MPAPDSRGTVAHLFFMVFALILAVAIPIKVVPSFASPLLAAFLNVSAVIIVYRVLLLMNLRLSGASISLTGESKNHSLKRHCIFFVLLVSSYGAYLAAFFPAAMSYDSVNQWHQMATFSFNDWHPPLYALMMFLLTRLWFSPAAIAVFQITVQALVICFALFTLARLGASRRLTWGLALFFALFPVYGIYSVILWKDVLFSSALLLLTVMLLRILTSRGAALDSRLFQVILGVILASILLLRHDGILPYVGSIVGLCVLVLKRPRRILFVLLVSMGLTLAINFPVYSALKVARFEGSILPGKLHLFQIAAVVASGSSISPEEGQTIEKTLSLEEIRKRYTPYASDNLLVAPSISWEWLANEGNERELFWLWLELVRRNPEVIARHIYRNRSILWRVVQFPDAYTASYWLGLDPNSDNLKMTPIHQGWHEFLKNSILAPLGSKRHYSWLFFRPALFLYVAFFVSSVLVFKMGSYRWILLLLPLAMNTLTYVLLCPVQDVRYFYPVILIAPFLMGVSLVVSRTGISTPDQEEGVDFADMDGMQKTGREYSDR